MAKANTGTTVKKVLLRIKLLLVLFDSVNFNGSSDRGIIFICADFNRKCDWYIIGPQNVEFKAITAILSEVGIVIAITGTVPVDYEYLQQQNYVSCDKGYSVTKRLKRLKCCR